MGSCSLAVLAVCVLLHCSVRPCSGSVSSRVERVWPIGGTTNVDLGQSSPYGPRLQISSNSKYDFHPGVDIPTPLHSDVYAVADGTVRINGSHPAYSDGVVQLKHTNWEEDPDGVFYTNYMHIVMNKSGADPISLMSGESVTKGQKIAYSHGTSSLAHIHFEVRVNSLYKKAACNPWKYMPNSVNDYSSFQVTLSVTPNYNGINCQAVVNVSVPPNQLTLSRVELHILDASDVPQPVRFYDMCGTNYNRTQSQVDKSDYLGNISNPSSYHIIISPMFFNSQSYSQNQNAGYGFELINLPQLGEGGTVMARVIDVFDNSVSTEYVGYSCSLAAAEDCEDGCEGVIETVSRGDRVWPIGGTTSVDLGQSSPYGPRLQISRNRIYDFHPGVDIPTPLHSDVYAVADGTVRINGSHPAYSDGVVQLKHTNWEEDPDGVFYTNYIHIVMNKSGADPISLMSGDSVTKGQKIAYSYGTPSLEHIHFEVRTNSLYKKAACNPWKYMPNSANDYSSFQVTLSVTPNYNGINCQAVVNVSVPPNQLTLSRVELHIVDASNVPQPVRFYDMCGTNYNRTQSQIDNSDYLGNISNPSSYHIIISPMFFNSQSYSQNQNAGYGFEFIDLPQLGEGGRVMARVIDVFDNSVSTEYVEYSCPLAAEGVIESQRATEAATTAANGGTASAGIGGAYGVALTLMFSVLLA